MRSTLQAAVFVDDRWSGQHGIGRFASEVVSRLSLPWVSLGGSTSPTSRLEALNPRRMFLRSTDTVYSPGFNAGFTRAKQLLVIHDLIHLQASGERTMAKTLFYNTVARWAIQRAGRVLTVSDTSAKAIRAWVGTPAVEIVVGRLRPVR